MEEDIKILEEKLETIESLCTDNCINKSTVIKPLKYSIENLIKGYRELEEKINKQKQLTKLAQTITDESVKEAIIEFEKDYIPKSKVKEKIEELKTKPLKIKENDKYYYETKAYNSIVIQVLQELLEE